MVPPSVNTSLDFSSRADDGGAAATAWRNVFFPFPETCHVPPRGSLCVKVVADLRTLSPSYEITVELLPPPYPVGDRNKRSKPNTTPVFHTFVRNFYPIFSNG